VPPCPLELKGSHHPVLSIVSLTAEGHHTSPDGPKAAILGNNDAECFTSPGLAKLGKVAPKLQLATVPWVEVLSAIQEIWRNSRQCFETGNVVSLPRFW
jgi:hypothetical protein